MALSASIVWEVRPSVGSDSNGGGFDPSVTSPGTDYSQQNSAQFSGTAGTAAGTAAFTDVGHSFTSADVGNLICIASGSGFTAGWYTIVSVAAGTATLDRSPGTGTVAHWALGGALLTFQNLINNSVMPNGNLVYIKNTGNVVLTNFISNLGVQCAFGRPSCFGVIGYGTTRGDATQATITTSTNSVSLFGGDTMKCYFTNIIFSTTAGTPALGFTQTGSSFPTLAFTNCKFTGFTQAISASVFTFTMINCEVASCTSSTGAISLGTNQVAATFNGCYFHGNTGPAVTMTNSGNGFNGTLLFTFCVLYLNGKGISGQSASNSNTNSAAWVLINCAIVSNTGDGIVMGNSSGTNYCPLTLINCVIENNGGYGVDIGTAAAASTNSWGPTIVNGANNAYRNNTSGDRNNFPALPGDVALTGEPFNNISSGDFTLNSTAGAGAACKAAGFQSTLI
jgi:hypothetical protein